MSKFRCFALFVLGSASMAFGSECQAYTVENVEFSGEYVREQQNSPLFRSIGGKSQHSLELMTDGKWRIYAHDEKEKADFLETATDDVTGDPSVPRDWQRHTEKFLPDPDLKVQYFPRSKVVVVSGSFDPEIDAYYQNLDLASKSGVVAPAASPEPYTLKVSEDRAAIYGRGGQKIVSKKLNDHWFTMGVVKTPELDVKITCADTPKRGGEAANNAGSPSDKEEEGEAENLGPKESDDVEDHIDESEVQVLDSQNGSKTEGVAVAESASSISDYILIGFGVLIAMIFLYTMFYCYMSRNSRCSKRYRYQTRKQGSSRSSVSNESSHDKAEGLLIENSSEMSISEEVPITLVRRHDSASDGDDDSDDDSASESV